jgi:ubiquinone/menaquinone biosynthesis C-methylase UbiE
LTTTTTDELYQAAYDRVAARYDDLFSRHVKTPNDRLTRGLGLRRGERLVDLACGSGAATLPMMRLTAPAETVAVDPSEGMLSLAREAADTEGLKLTAIKAKAEDFIAAAPTASFDVVSMRFALAYLDWHTVLPAMARLLRPGGRIGLVTSLATSAPQALTIYHRLAESMDMETVPLPTPKTSGQVEELLTRGGVRIEDSWQHGFRLWFDTGAEATRWLIDTGYVAHPALNSLDDDVLDGLVGLFGAHLENEFREDEGVPLDFFVAGIIARRP